MDFSLNEAERDLAELCRDVAQKEITHRAPIAREEARWRDRALRRLPDGRTASNGIH